MQANLAGIAVAMALVLGSGRSDAMTTANTQVECYVIDGGKLPENSDGANALCRAIRAAIGKQADKEKYRVRVVVLGPSRISVEVTSSSGRKLVQQKYGSMDRELSNSSFERIANGLAAEILSASKEGLR